LAEIEKEVNLLPEEKYQNRSPVYGQEQVNIVYTSLVHRVGTNFLLGSQLLKTPPFFGQSISP